MIFVKRYFIPLVKLEAVLLNMRRTGAILRVRRAKEVWILDSGCWILVRGKDNAKADTGD